MIRASFAALPPSYQEFWPTHFKDLSKGELHTKYYKVQTQMTQFLFLTKYVEFFLKYIFIGHSGRYYSDCQEKPEAPLGQDDETAEKLWDLSAKLVNL